jgi:hypothetical protein
MGKIILVSICLLGVSSFAAGKVFFESPKDGAKVTSPLKVKMGLKGMKLRPAGEAVDDKKSGHHHILVDLPAIPAGEPIPADEHHIHFGKAQTETEVKLTPGDHTLTLQLADGAHRSYGPEMSATIKVHVEAKK